MAKSKAIRYDGGYQNMGAISSDDKRYNLFRIRWKTNLNDKRFQFGVELKMGAYSLVMSDYEALNLAGLLNNAANLHRPEWSKNPDDNDIEKG